MSGVSLLLPLGSAFWRNFATLATVNRQKNHLFSSLLRSVLRGRSSNLAAVLMFPSD